MQQVQLDIFQGQSGNSSIEYRDELPVNVYHIPKQISGVSGYLRSQWGLTSKWVGVNTSQGGIWSTVFNSQFRVSGSKLVELVGGVLFNRGDIGYSGQCRLNQTERNIVVTTDSSCWLYNPTDGLREITDPDLGPVFDTVYINQRLIHTDGEFIIVSEPGQDDVYSALKYGTAEIDPDGIVGLETVSNRLLAVGRNTIEWFADQPVTGDSFPYVRIESQLVEAGAIATHAKVRMNDNSGYATVFFVGSGKNDSLSVMQVGAGNAPKVSTDEVDMILASYTEEEIKTTVMENRTVDGCNFVIVHLPNETLMLDLTASAAVGKFTWTMAKSRVDGKDVTARWINGVFDPNQNAFVYGDKFTGNISVLDKNINTEYGEARREFIYCSTLPIDYKSVSKLSIKTLPGRNQPSTEPVMFLSTIENFGLIWSQEHLISRGTQGNYQNQVEVRNLGFYRRDVSIRLRMESKQPVSVLSVIAEIS